MHKTFAFDRDAGMRHSQKYEVAAILLALVGVVMFGFGIYPVVNPIQFGLDLGPGYLPASLFSLVGSIVVLWIALRLSRESQRIEAIEKSEAGS
jgi:hypothetical protein